MVGRGDIPVSIGAAGPGRPANGTETWPTGTGYAELRGERQVHKNTDFTAVPAARCQPPHRHPDG
jgi:hypothetical protein